MTLDGSFSPRLKRKRLSSIDSMESETAKAKHYAVKEKFGRELRVFETTSLSQSPEEASANDDTDDFYEFTTEDYHRILATKKEDKFLKTRKIREAEEAARRSRITKAIIRVRFPDNITLEANFHPSETLQALFDLLNSVLTRPELPFYLYTTPPKKQIKDLMQDFFSAGFIPGAIVYFAYDLPKDNHDATAANAGPFLLEEIVDLKDAEIIPEWMPEHNQSTSEPAATDLKHSPASQQQNPADKKPAKPKWFKMKYV